MAASSGLKNLEYGKNDFSVQDNLITYIKRFGACSKASPHTETLRENLKSRIRTLSDAGDIYRDMVIKIFAGDLDHPNSMKALEYIEFMLDMSKLFDIKDPETFARTCDALNRGGFTNK